MPVFGPRKPQPTPTETFVQQEFPEAAALAAGSWRDFVQRNRALDPDWEQTFTLRQRLKAFMAGPIVATLETRFPRIVTFAEDADAMTELAGHEGVVLRSIVGEGVIACGTHSREEVRSALSGWPSAEAPPLE